MRDWKRWATIAYLIILIPLALWLIGTRWDSVVALSEGVSGPLIATAVLLAFAPPAVSSYYWCVALNSLGNDISYRTVATTTLRSLLSRYLPGGVWYAASRVVLLTNRGIRASHSGLVAATELAMTVLIALAVGAPVVAIGAGRTGLATVLIVASVTGLAFGQPIVRWLVRRVNTDDAATELSSRTYLRLIGITLVFWSALAGLFIFYMRAVGVGTDINAATLGGAYAVSWVSGWLAPFAPQGLGVFEATIAALLRVGDIADLAIVILGFRAVLLLRDLIGAAVGAALPGGVRSGK